MLDEAEMMDEMGWRAGKGSESLAGSRAEPCEGPSDVRFCVVSQEQRAKDDPREGFEPSAFPMGTRLWIRIDER